MKFHYFNLMPYKFLPPDFSEKYHSVWVDIPRDLFDAEKAGDLYNEYIDGLVEASTLGFDGICVNEHHSNAYGLMPSPNIIASILAAKTKDVAIITLGNSIALYNPPIRVAEEMAMMDCISGGRLVAGFPVGTSMDTNYAYGVNPVTLRDRYREAEELIVKAWTAKDIFTFNGQYTQLRYVNAWPKPIQEPHPPVWIPGGGSVETWDWTCEKNYMYAALAFSGYLRAQKTFDGFWQAVDRHGLERNPYRAGFIQFVCVADNEDMAAEMYGPHLEWFYNKTQHVYGGFTDAPGYRTGATIQAGFTSEQARPRVIEQKWPQLKDEGVVIAGSPKQVAEQIETMVTDLNVGHLMFMSSFGSMPKETASYNTRRIAAEVLPGLRHLHAEWTDEWFPANAHRAEVN